MSDHWDVEIGNPKLIWPTLEICRRSVLSDTRNFNNLELNKFKKSHFSKNVKISCILRCVRSLAETAISWNQIWIDVFNGLTKLPRLNKEQQRASYKPAHFFVHLQRHNDSINWHSILSNFYYFQSLLDLWLRYHFEYSDKAVIKFNNMSTTTRPIGKSHIPQVPRSLTFLRILQLLLGVTLLGLSAYGINVYSTTGFDLTLFTVFASPSQ